MGDTDQDGATPPPVLSAMAVERWRAGTASLLVRVSRRGTVCSVVIGRSSGDEALDRAAVESVRAWTFLPAQKDGGPVTSWVLLPFRTPGER